MTRTRPHLPAVLAAAWGVIFALPHMLWGMGWFRESLRFSLGASPGPDEEELISDPAFIATGLWGVAALCLLASLIAASTFQPWARRLPRWMPIAGTWGVCAILAIRGIFFPGLIGSIAIETGVFTPESNTDPAWIRWNLVLWSPWFLLGATLFGLAARNAMRRR